MVIKHKNMIGSRMYGNVTLWLMFFIFAGCSNNNVKNQKQEMAILMEERQISFSEKNHSLDNNDNFSPDNKFLCYDTRGTVYNDNIGNCKTIEKIEISTGSETVLYHPESVTGEQAAPGVGAVSWHPALDKVIFIHGPPLGEVDERGYYGFTNRTGVEVSADGREAVTYVDLRDVQTDRATIPGAQRGGTHRHEYSWDGQRIGFTYDDFLNTNYDRTIGYLERSSHAPDGYSHYFAVILKTIEKGQSKPGEIEKAYGDSWADPKGTMRAFIGKVRSENGTDYQTDVFVADIPETVDITTAYSGNGREYPEPPEGIEIRRLTHSGEAEGIVRGSFDGKMLAYLSPDNAGTKQVFTINSMGSDESENQNFLPKQLTSLDSSVSTVRWHPKKDWLFVLSNGNVAAVCAETGPNYGRTFMLTNDAQERGELVVSNDGETLSYTILKENISGSNPQSYTQIFVLDIDWDRIIQSL